MITAEYLGMPLCRSTTNSTTRTRTTSLTARSTNSACSAAATATCSAIRRRRRVRGARRRSRIGCAVEGKGTVHSYTEVHHAIQPAFKKHVPYLILLVELDTQSGKPTPTEALRVIGNLTTPDGVLASKERVARVGIGTRDAHGVLRRRAGTVDPAMDDRRERRARRPRGATSRSKRSRRDRPCPSPSTRSIIWSSTSRTSRHRLPGISACSA